ncbi:MAG TPA: hypothetical protein PLN21_06605 [Gemmatales bacterium]|nr:hypothetical protein [Gemmatales bacterium]
MTKNRGVQDQHEIPCSMKNALKPGETDEKIIDTEFDKLQPSLFDELESME